MASEMTYLNPVFGVSSVSADSSGANGDGYLIRRWGGHVFVALIDGLGHGKGAAKASATALDYMSETYNEDLERIMCGLHSQLVKTRGAVVGLVRVDEPEKRLTFCGVGNIEVRVVSNPPMHPASLNGVVGMGKIRPKKFEYNYSTMEILALHTDGVSSKFELPNNTRQQKDAQRLAEDILNEHWNQIDDATVIIAVWDQNQG